MNGEASLQDAAALLMHDAPKRLGSGGQNDAYSPARAAEVCDRIAAGETLTAICDEPHMPRTNAVYDWCARFPQFEAALSRARVRAADAYFAKALTLASAPPRTIGADDRVDSGWVQWVKNQVDLLKWAASVFNRQRYGDKVEVEHTGSVQLQPEDVRAALVASQARRGRVIEVEPQQLPDAGA